MGIAILGPLSIDGRSASLGRRDRVVLAALAVRPGEVLSADRLADALWGDDPPASAAKVVQGCIARLRKVLGAGAIETEPYGYRLAVPLEEIDAQRFVRGVERARVLLTTAEDADRAVFVLSDVLALWRGQAFAELDGWDIGRIERGRLDELHLEAEELYVEATLRVGHWDTVLARAEAMVQEQPLRERRWALLALAQYQSGRQSDALLTLRRVRSLLHRELGLDPGPELMELERAVLCQDPALVVRTALPEPSPVCPYRGLLPYDTVDADCFFGRGDDVEACLRRLGASRVLAVVGPSGSGKSSMVRAGVVASLRRDGRSVLVTTPGVHPVAALADLSRLGRTATLVVDQCEEIYSLCRDLDERTRYLDRLVEHAATGSLVVVLRADHLVDVSAHRAFAGLVERGMHLMAAMREEDLRAAIEEPARLAGLTVEPVLVQILVREVAGSPGALPMMSHALQETWQRREGRTLTRAGYQASGGIQEAVARSAEEIYTRVGEDQHAMLRNLLLRLVTPGAKGEPVRSRLPRRQVVTGPEYDRMVDLLVGSRLVTSDDGVVELAHEALARAWPRLRDWLEEDVEGQRTLHHLAAAADSWDTLGRPDSELYRGVRLAKGLDWRARKHPDLSETEKAFLDAGERLSRAELDAAEQRARRQRQVNHRLRGLLATTAVLLLVAATVGVYAVRQSSRAKSAAETSRRAATAADARRVGTRAQLSDDISLSLLLAAAGVDLADSPDTQMNLLAALNRHPGLVRSEPAAGGYIDLMDVSPDGRLIAAADDRNQMHLYDARTNRLLRSYSAGRASDGQAFTYPAFSPDGRYLAVGQDPGGQRPLRMLDPRTMDLARITLANSDTLRGRVNDLQFSADGTRFAAAVQQNPGANEDWFVQQSAAYVWDLRSPSSAPARVPLDNAAQGLALSPDGRTIYTAWPLTAYDTASGRRLWRRDDVHTFLQLDINPAGTLLALELHDGVKNNYMLIVDARTGKTVYRLVGDQEMPRALRFSHDGTLLASASNGGEIIIWDVGTGRVQNRWKTFEQSWSVGFSPDDGEVYTGGDDGMLRTWDLKSRATYLRRTTTVAGAPVFSHADVSPDGRRVAFRWPDGQDGKGWIRIADTLTGAATPRQSLRVFDGPWTPGVWRPDGRQYASHPGCNEPSVCEGAAVTLVDAHTGERNTERRLVGPQTIFSMTYVGEGRSILVGDSDGKTTVLDAHTLRPRGDPLDIHSDCCATPVAGGRTAVLYEDSADSASERWRLVELASGKVLKAGDLKVHAFASTASPDGRWVAVSGLPGEVVAIELATGRQVHGSTGVSAEVRWLRYSDDGTRLASGASDGEVSLWDAENLRLLGSVFPPHQGPAVPATAEFVGGSHDVTIASYDGQVYRWDTDPRRAVDFACHMAGRNLTRDEWSEFLPTQRFRKVCPGQ